MQPPSRTLGGEGRRGVRLAPALRSRDAKYRPGAGSGYSPSLPEGGRSRTGQARAQPPCPSPTTAMARSTEGANKS